MRKFPSIRPPYPDELLHAYILSLCRDNIIPPQRICGDVLDMDGGKYNHIAKRYDSLYPLKHFAELVGIDDPYSFFLKTSVYNAISPFIDPNIRSEIIGLCFSDFRKRSKIWFNLRYSFIKDLKICPNCKKEDKEEYGDWYFHRSHQLNGVHVCYKHGSPLLPTSWELSMKDLEIKKINEDIDMEKEKEHAEFVYLLLNLEENEELRDKWIEKLSDYPFAYGFIRDALKSFSSKVSYKSMFFVDDVLRSIIFYLKNGYYPSDNIKIRKNKSYEIIESLGDNIYRCKCLVCGREFISTKNLLSLSYLCPCSREDLNDEETIRMIVRKKFSKRFKLLYVHYSNQRYFLLLYDKDNKHVLLIRPATLFFGKVDSISGASATRRNGKKKRPVDTSTLSKLPFTIYLDNKIHIHCKECDQTYELNLTDTYILDCPICNKNNP